MDYEEDDDVSFAKWMSSFWGHNVPDENDKASRSYRQWQTRSLVERRASLPAKLSSIHMTRFHASTKIPSPSHLRDCKEIREDQDSKCHCHVKARKKSSNGNSPQRTSGPNNLSNSILEFSESFERQLHFKNKRSVSLPKTFDSFVSQADFDANEDSLALIFRSEDERGITKKGSWKKDAEEPEGMKQRRERERLRSHKSRSHKKTGEKKEPKNEQVVGEISVEVPAEKHS